MSGNVLTTKNTHKCYKYKKRISPTKAQTRFHVAPWMQYAAIILFVFGSTFVFYLSDKSSDLRSPMLAKQIVVHNTRGVYQLVLPDSSKVWLHGGTTLTYPEQFSDSIRTVNLQGEAYFVVQADIVHPFVVQTPTARIRATGTEFNITAYPNDKMTTTTLVKGIVDIQPNHLTTAVKLKPHQQASVKAEDNLIHVVDVNNPKIATTEKNIPPVIVQGVNIELFADWKDGVYRFKKEPFQNIVLRLEKMYGVNIQIESENLRKASFSGMFTTDYSLKEIFEIINISNPIVYRVENKTVYIKKSVVF